LKKNVLPNFSEGYPVIHPWPGSGLPREDLFLALFCIFSKKKKTLKTFFVLSTVTNSKKEEEERFLCGRSLLC
jgi:hypothetical protein